MVRHGTQSSSSEIDTKWGVLSHLYVSLQILFSTSSNIPATSYRYLKPNSWSLFYPFDGNFMADQCSDVTDPISDDPDCERGSEHGYLKDVPDHCRSLEAEAPPVDMYIFREAHRLKHLRPEHATVANLDPLAEMGMEGEDFK